jgi:hypothetical protein
MGAPPWAGARAARPGWATYVAVGLALAIGAAVAMATMAFAAQRYFESRAESAAAIR